MKYSLYNKLVLLITGLWLLPLFALCLYMEPDDSELTRMGGYLENNYGRNIPQEHFTEALFTIANSVSDYTQYYDIVVYGDSFSENKSHGWLNYLANETGLTIIVFNMNWNSLSDILSSPFYSARPPKLFIYESVERNLLTRHDQCQKITTATNIAFTPPDIKIEPLKVSISSTSRHRTIYSIAGLDFNSTINYFKKMLLREIFNINITEVHRYQLSRADLFSNRASDSLLTITRDFKIKNASNKQIQTAQCSLLALQKKIRHSNKTDFIAIFFPDKTTAYSKYILDETYTDFSIIDKIENTPDLNVTHLLADFRKSIDQGVRDFYLPNDTHCGSTAYKMAADEVIRLIKQTSR